MTLEQIRAALPTHIMLTPGAPLTLKDSIYWCERWIECAKDDAFDRTIENFVTETPARRPIPPHILDNQAFYLLLDKGFESRDHFADKAENLGIVRKLGGLDNYRAQTKAGRLYDKWLLEQIESGG